MSCPVITGILYLFCLHSESLVLGQISASFLCRVVRGLCVVTQMISHHSSAHQSRHHSHQCRRRPAAAPRSPHSYTPSSLLDTLYQNVVLMRERHHYENANSSTYSLIMIIADGNLKTLKAQNKKTSGTHRAEHSPETPAGLLPHLLFAPWSAANEDGFGKLWEYGPDRW